MSNKPIEPIIKKTGKALSVPQEIIPLKKKKKRAKPPIYDLSEKAFAEQIKEVTIGKKESKKSEVKP